MARILVVDDESTIRELVKEVLSINDHAVDTASNGKEAIDSVKKTPYDLVIIDRHMPIMSGIDAINIIRSTPKFKDLKILMFTTASVTKEVEEAYAAGATGYLIKPFNVKQFMEKVQTTLKG